MAAEHPFDKPSPNWIEAVKEGNTKQIEKLESEVSTYLKLNTILTNPYPHAKEIVKRILAYQHPVPDASQPAAVPDKVGYSQDLKEKLFLWLMGNRKLDSSSANIIIEHFERYTSQTIHPPQPAGNDVVRFAPVEISAGVTHHCGNEITEKEVFFDHCLKCGEYLKED